LMQVIYEQKAPAFANVDNLKEIFEKHFGRVHTDIAEYSRIVKEEEGLKPAGAKLAEVTTRDGKAAEIYKVCLDDQSLLETSFYIQTLLPFFIDGASQIEPSQFWQYFLVYDKESGALMGLASVFEAHITSERVRAKVS